MELTHGTQIGDWRLDKPIGSGGQGTVWQVRYTKAKHSPPAALKLCRSQDAQARARFAREADLLAKFDHPGIIRIRDRGQWQDIPFVVMERATVSLGCLADPEAGPGAQLLRVSPTLLLRFFRQVCEAVAHLHAEGVLHRDLKPSNLLLVQDGREPLRAVVADLGIAVAEAAQGELTKTHEVVGPMIYRAPEVGVGNKATKRSDVYGLARVLEYLVTGQHPAELEPAPCPRGGQLDEVLCEALDAIIARGTSWKPADRFADAADVVSALPRTVVTVAGGTIARPGGEESSLDDRAASVLGCLIAESADQGEVSMFQVRHELRGRVTGYDLAMAVRRLVRAGLVHERSDADINGNEFTLLRVTDAGIAWADQNDDRVRTLTGRGSPPEKSSADFSDDEIPF